MGRRYRWRRAVLGLPELRCKENGMNKGVAGALGLILLWIAFAAFFVAFHPGGLTVNGKPAQNPRDVILWFMQRAAQGTGNSSTAQPELEGVAAMADQSQAQLKRESMARIAANARAEQKESRTKRAARTVVRDVEPESRVAVKAQAKPRASSSRLGPSADSYARKAREGALSEPPRRPGGGARKSAAQYADEGRARPRKALKSLAGRASGGTLLAEYFLGVVILCISGLTKGPSAGYTDAMSELMLRLTALTGVFFVLFLLTGSERGGKAAALFGVLIDLGIVYTAAQGNTIQAIAAVMRGQPTNVVDDATLISNTTVDEPTPPQLPNE